MYHVSIQYLHEQAQYEGPAVRASRGGCLDGGHHLGVARGTAYACGSAANWHQVRCGRCLNDDCRLWWQRLVGMMRRWLRHGWIQWGLCGSAGICGLVGLCGREAWLWLRHLAVWWWLLAVHVDLSGVISLTLALSLSVSLSCLLSLSCCSSSSTATLGGSRFTDVDEQFGNDVARLVLF